MTVDACAICGSPCQICAERRAAADTQAQFERLRVAAARCGPTVKMSVDVAIAEMQKQRTQ